MVSRVALCLVAFGCGRLSFDRVPADALGGDAQQICDGIERVSTGRGFTCAIRTGGSVACWGANYDGELGIAEGSRSLAAVEVSLPGAARAIDSGAGHSCAVIDDGRVFCWGRNEIGQLGDGTTTKRTGPVQAILPGPADEVATGSRHSCARIAADGRVFCWGQNTRNELGDGGGPSRGTPMPVTNVTGVHGLVAGHSFSCAITATGDVACWGSNVSGNLGDGNTTAATTPVLVNTIGGVVGLTAGSRFACARTSDGALNCWGANNLGQLATGDFTNQPAPILVSPGGVMAIAAGRGHTCIATATDVRCVGTNRSGQLADGTLASTTRFPVTGFPISGLRQLIGKYNHSCLIDDAGLRCWGHDQDGQLGDGIPEFSSVPVAVAGVTDADKLMVTHSYACVVSGSEPRCWGELASDVGNVSPGPIAITSAADVAGGYGHTCARSGGPTSTASCIGFGGDGQLGHGSTSSSGTPVAVVGLSNVTAIAAATLSTCAVDSGTVSCWGKNDRGQLGDGSTTDRSQPVATSVTNATQVSMNNKTTCARLSTGSVSCWGDNSARQLGDNTAVAQRSMPTPIASGGIGSIAQVSVGYTHACLRAEDGSVWCWGGNGAGQCGTGAFTSVVPIPQRVNNLPLISHIATGEQHTCAVATTGEVWCWGANDIGQLGDGNPGAPSNMPLRVQGLPAFALSVGAGDGYACALLVDMTVQCWGKSTQGQLGAGTPLLGTIARPAVAPCQ